MDATQKRLYTIHLTIPSRQRNITVTMTQHETYHDKRGMCPCNVLLLHQSTQLEIVTFPVVICIHEEYTAIQTEAIENYNG